MMTVHCHLWAPLEWARRNPARDGRPRPVPMLLLCYWHVLNADAIARSWTATDPFPSEVLT